MNKIKVMVADDHAILRAGLKALLATFDNIEVVGEASNGVEVIELVPKCSPEIILMDIAMPVLDGITATRRITKAYPGVKVIILSQHDNREYILSAIKAGASGYILKKAVSSDLIGGIEAVYGDGCFFYPSVAKTVIEDYLEQVKGDKRNEDTFERLSERECEVLKLIADGLSSNEIAQKLFISVKTVLGHRENIMGKLDIHNRTELVKYAIRKGLIQADS
jgi:DNA-binding NarL/FixJ family response regulator